MSIPGNPGLKKLIVGIVTVLALAMLFYWKAEQNYLRHDYVNSNFFSFWLSGHMAWTGESPYDSAQWMAGFEAAGATYRPSKILQYPLPLMYVMAPLGLLPVGAAYFTWQIVSQLIIAASVYLLLRRTTASQGMLVPIYAFLLFFGPAYLSLQIGSLGALVLLAVSLSLLLLLSGHPFPAGVALSLTLLKPPQALTLLLLAGIWFVARRNWRALAGVASGALALLIIWVARDPLGLVKFRGSSDFLLGHTLGVQANVFGFAYLACGQQLPCMWVSGSVAALAILGAGGYLLWRNRTQWDDWEAINLMIPLGFVTALYLWSYDQLLYIIPIVWVLARVMVAPRGYVWAIVVLVVLDAVSFSALINQAYTQRDLLSIVTTLVVLGLCLLLLRNRSAGARRGTGQLAGEVAPRK